MQLIAKSERNTKSNHDVCKFPNLFYIKTTIEKNNRFQFFGKESKYTCSGIYEYCF